MLLKNFGVSRHGRLIFYDYDELCLADRLQLPGAAGRATTTRSSPQEPWFYVGERDIFPEEFRAFLGLARRAARRRSSSAHEELLGVEFWHRMQELHRRGEVLDVFPYKDPRAGCAARIAVPRDAGPFPSREEPRP